MLKAGKLVTGTDVMGILLLVLKVPAGEFRGIAGAFGNVVAGRELTGMPIEVPEFP